MRIPSARPVGLLLLSLIALAACGKDSAAPQQMPMGAVSVVTLTSEPVTLTRELPGRTTPYAVAEVRPQVNGIVKERLFTEGGLVEAGQPLYQLDDATYRADHNSARANLARAQAALVTARVFARRTSDLAKSNLVSKQDDENANAAFRQAEADVKAAQAALDRSAVVLGYARITAPIGGRIGKSSVTQGALVTANQAAPLATVHRLDPIYVDLNQSSAELLQLRKSVSDGSLESTEELPVTIVLEDGSQYAHPGKLAFSEVTVDPSTGSFALRVEVPNPDGILLPGMYVRAVVGSGVRQDAVLVPQRGITRNPGGQTSAMVVDDEGKIELRQVVVNRTVGDKWLVDSGLSAGDRVVVEGLQKIQTGMPVQVTEVTEVTASEAGATEAADAAPAVGAAQ